MKENGKEERGQVKASATIVMVLTMKDLGKEINLMVKEGELILKELSMKEILKKDYQMDNVK